MVRELQIVVYMKTNGWHKLFPPLRTNMLEFKRQQSGIDSSFKLLQVWDYHAAFNGERREITCPGTHLTH